MEPEVARTGATSAVICYVVAASTSLNAATCVMAHIQVPPRRSARSMRNVDLEIQHKFWCLMEVIGTIIFTSAILCGAGDSACIAASSDVPR